jgi:hypothetical protein
MDKSVEVSRIIWNGKRVVVLLKNVLFWSDADDYFLCWLTMCKSCSCVWLRSFTLCSTARGTQRHSIGGRLVFIIAMFSCSNLLVCSNQMIRYTWVEGLHSQIFMDENSFTNFVSLQSPSCVDERSNSFVIFRIMSVLFSLSMRRGCRQVLRVCCWLVLGFGCGDRSTNSSVEVRQGGVVAATFCVLHKITKCSK